MTLQGYDVMNSNNVSEFTKPFTLPNTATNNKFFKTAYSVNGVSYNRALLNAAYLTVNGALFKSGNILLNQVIRNRKDGTYSYEVLFQGAVQNFMASIGALTGASAAVYNGASPYTPPPQTGRLSDLDMSKYNIDWTGLSSIDAVNGVTASWYTLSQPGYFKPDGNFIAGETGYGVGGPNCPVASLAMKGQDGDILFPLVNYGYDYNEINNQPTVPTHSVGYQFSFTGATFGPSLGYNPNPTAPLWKGGQLGISQMKPAIRARAIVDAIVNDAGYTYNSNFLNGLETVSQAPNFKFSNLYLSTENEERSRYPGLAYFKCTLLTLFRDNVIEQCKSTYNFEDSNFTSVGAHSYCLDYQPIYNVGPSFTDGTVGTVPVVITGTATRGFNLTNWNSRSGNPGIDATGGLAAYNGACPPVTFTAPVTGNYSFTVVNDQFFPSGTIGGIQWWSTGATTASWTIQAVNDAGVQYIALTGSTIHFVPTTSSSTAPVPASFGMNFTIFMNARDILQLQVTAPAALPVHSSARCSSVNMIWICTAWPTGMGSIQEMLPDNKKQVDFIKGLTDKFKLVWVADKSQPYHFSNVQPWTNWIQSGNKHDWTHKLDEGSPVTDTALYRDMKREMFFTDAEDADYLNYLYQQNNKYVYGWLRTDSGIQTITGEQKVEGFFAPVPLGPIGYRAGGSNEQVPDTVGMMIPHFAKADQVNPMNSVATSVGKILPIVQVPRLFYYNGVVPTPTYSFHDANTMWTAPTNFGRINWRFWDDMSSNGGSGYSPADPSNPGGGVVVVERGASSGPLAAYPLVSSVDHIGVFSPNTISQGPAASGLHWDYSSWINPPANSVAASSTYTSYSTPVPNLEQGAAGAFQVYWSKWFNCMYDPFASKLSMTLVLTYQDVQQLQFNDQVYIVDSWYFVTSIEDYIVGEICKCKVNLIKINNYQG
jgi:hypothetical protein